MVNHWENPESVLRGNCLCNIPEPSYTGICTRCNRIVHLAENSGEESNSTSAKPSTDKSDSKKISRSLGDKYCSECKLSYKNSSSFVQIVEQNFLVRNHSKKHIVRIVEKSFEKMVRSV